MTTALEAILQSLDSDSGRPRVEYRGRFYSGADLRGRIAARAADLRAAGLCQGDKVLIIVSENLAAIEQLLACWVCGAAGVFVDFRSPASRIEEWRSRVAPRLVIGVRAVAGQPVHLQPSDPALVVPLTLAADLSPGRVALCVSSSGTTGLPKLLDVVQDRLFWILQTLNDDALSVRAGTFLSAQSVSFSASCYVWLRLLLSGRLILALDLIHRIAELDTALRRLDVVETVLAPSLLRQLAALPDTNIPRYPQLLRLACVGGPARPEDKVAAVTRLSPAYVMNYSCVGVGTITRITGAEILDRPSACGRPLPGVTVEIRDGERLCAPGEIGEIHVSTPRLSDHRPGDLGWLDEDGNLYLTGRVQGLLSRKGVNFTAERLVSAALGWPTVIEAGVAALQDGDLGDEVHLVVQAAPADVAAVRDGLPGHLRQALPAAEFPDRLHVWTALPITSGGKVDSRALTRMVKEARDDVTAG
jgi:acyl-coenzyme A synthetase/AMP-(fatty) acid ligase